MPTQVYERVMVFRRGVDFEYEVKEEAPIPGTEGGRGRVYRGRVYLYELPEGDSWAAFLKAKELAILLSGKSEEGSCTG